MFPKKNRQTPSADLHVSGIPFLDYPGNAHIMNKVALDYINQHMGERTGIVAMHARHGPHREQQATAREERHHHPVDQPSKP